MFVVDNLIFNARIDFGFLQNSRVGNLLIYEFRVVLLYLRHLLCAKLLMGMGNEI